MQIQNVINISPRSSDPVPDALSHPLNTIYKVVKETDLSPPGYVSNSRDCRFWMAFMKKFWNQPKNFPKFSKILGRAQSNSAQEFD
jgi:secreted Zn-dependent insulinase-like peptidase